MSVGRFRWRVASVEIGIDCVTVGRCVEGPGFRSSVKVVSVELGVEWLSGGCWVMTVVDAAHMGAIQVVRKH